MVLARRVLAVLLLASCGFLAAYIAFRSSHRTPALTAIAASDQSAEQAHTAGPPIPDTLPDARVPDLSGKPKSIRDFLGHPLIVNFWATWCAPCRREMPLLQQLQQRYRDQGLQVLGVAVDSRDAVEQYLRVRPVNYPILADEAAATEAMNRFGAEPVLPLSVFADAQGQVVVVKLGELHADEADYILATVRELAAGHQSISQARAAIATRLHQLAIAHAKAGASS